MRVLGFVFVLLVLLTGGCGETPERSGAAPTNPDTSSQETANSRDETTAVGSGQALGLRTVTIHTSGGEEVEVRVEIADNALGQWLGLRGRENLPEDRGMLFVYPEEQRRTFTMADTPTPLSIAFIDSGKRIIDVQDMKPLDDEPPGYVSAEPAQYALEVNQGFYDERGVEVGDRVTLPE